MAGTLIVALDLDTRAEAERLVERLGNAAGFYKIGYQSFYGGDGLALGKALLEAGDAYGARQDEMVLTVPAAEAPEGLTAGQAVMLGDHPATVVQVTDEAVVVDANHPLAGEALTFDIELVSID